MGMQPRPIAPTSSPWLPSLRLLKVMPSSRKYSAGLNQALAQTPKAVSRFGIDRVGHHAEVSGPISAVRGGPVILGHRPGHIAVLTVDAAHAVELRARRAPHAGCRALLDRLELS